MEIKVAIVDDSLEDREMIKKCFSNIEFENVTFFINEYDDITFAMSSMEYDLYLLDLDMPTVTGIQLAKDLNQNNPSSRIIFVSYREDLVFDSFSVDSLYFVRKNRLNEDLKKALTKYVHHYVKINQIFLINNGKDQIRILYKDIQYFEVFKNDLYIITKQQKYIVRKTMKEVIQEINDDFFVRIHSSFLVNLNNIARINGDLIIMKNNLMLKISRRKIKEFNKIFSEFVVMRDVL